MITPRFSCDQTSDTVIVSLYCPSVRTSDVEITVDDTLLTVYINPYFLRLHFPHPVTEDDSSTALYDPGTGYLMITLTKAVKGQTFPDLDLLAKLLAPRTPQTLSAPSIEILETAQGEDDDSELSSRTTKLTLEENDEFLRAAEDDWQVPQTLPEAASEVLSSPKRYYGFLNKYTGYFMHVVHTENEINELGNNAESCGLNERRNLRVIHENEKWDEEHYMADYADDEYIQELIAWEDPANNSDIIYTEQEKMEMLGLPRKEYIIDGIEERKLYLSLITLLFAYAYDVRTTLRDPTPESAWTMCSLVPEFSALDQPPYTSAASETRADHLRFTGGDLTSTMATSYRRSLAFPLYRSYQLSEACRRDVASYMTQGKRMITRCLLEMRRILDHHEVYYVYSRIWLDDFCVWIQTRASDNVLQQLAGRLDALQIAKHVVGWELEQLEEATRFAACKSSDSDDESIE